MPDPYSTIDYANTKFEHPTLLKIHGQPTFATLTKLKKQLKANAKSVRSNLGGGALGHLGLVLSPQEYALLCNTPFEEPEHPGLFRPPRNAAPLQAIQAEKAHEESIRLFQ